MRIKARHPKAKHTKKSYTPTSVEYGVRPKHDKDGKPIPYHLDLFYDLNIKMYGSKYRPGLTRIARADEFKRVHKKCPNCGYSRAWEHDDLDVTVCDRCRYEY